MNVATFEDIEQTVLYLLGRIDQNTYLGACVQLLYNTGLRVDEACELPRFSLSANTFTVDTEKKSYNRTFDLALLPAYYLQYLPYVPIPFGIDSVCSPSTVCRFVLANSPKIFYKNKKKIASNVFRYYYARRLEQEGYTVAEIQAQMGHSNIASTLAYLAPIMYP